MQEIIKLLIGIFILLLGIPIGNFLAKQTKEELKEGRKYFVILVILGLIGGAIGLIIRNDVILFTMFFIVIVTLKSLKKDRKLKR